MPLPLGVPVSAIRPATVRKRLRRMLGRGAIVGAARLRAVRPGIFDTQGARFLKRTVTARGIMRAQRSVR